MRALRAGGLSAARWLVAISTLPATAASQPSTDERAGVFLSWVRGPSATTCGDASSVQADVSRRLGWSPFTGTPSRSIEVLVLREGTQWRADIQVRSTDGSSLGSRRVTSQAANCDSLAAAAALAIALLIDPDALLDPPPAEPAPSPPGAKPVPDRPVAECPVQEPCPLRVDPAARGSLSVASAGALGLLPEAAFGLALVGEVRALPKLSLLLGAAFLPEKTTNAGGANVAFGLSFLKAGPCRELMSNSEIGLALCASVLVGAMHAVVFDPEPVDVGQRFWWAASGGFRGYWAFARPFTMAADVDLVLPLSRRDNVVSPGGSAPPTSIFEEPALGFMAFIGPGVEF